jgi:hypothetical protein
MAQLRQVAQSSDLHRLWFTSFPHAHGGKMRVL